MCISVRRFSVRSIVRDFSVRKKVWRKVYHVVRPRTFKDVTVPQKILLPGHGTTGKREIREFPCSITRYRRGGGSKRVFIIAAGGSVLRRCLFFLDRGGAQEALFKYVLGQRFGKQIALAPGDFLLQQELTLRFGFHALGNHR